MARTLWLILVLILLLVALCACQPIFETAEAAADQCTVEGTWVGSYSGGPWEDPLILQYTLVPLDPAGKRLSYVMRMVNPDATFRIKPFETADYLSDLVGEAVKSGPGTYDISVFGYGVNEREGDRNEILYLFGITGIMTCDGETISQEALLSVYAADADKDNDGFPDEGAEPVFCHPTEFPAAKPIPMSPWCEPPAEEAVIVTDAADIVGTWLGVDFDFYHQFNEDGTLSAATSPDIAAENTLFTGEYWFEDGQLYMKETEVFGIPACGEEPAIYEARILANGNLSLAMVEDSCEPRVEATNRDHAPVR